MSTNEKVYLRRGEARELLGVSDEVFTKLIRAGALKPKCFPGGTRAFFERTQVEAVKPQPREEQPQKNAENTEKKF